MFLKSGAPELVHNTDIQSQLTKLAEAADFDWIAAASDRLAEVERGMRRNLLRSLSLDAWPGLGERLRNPDQKNSQIIEVKYLESMTCEISIRR